MKKGKGTMIITIGIICFVLTYVMFMQFKTVEETNITQIENMRETELTEKLASWKEKYQLAEEKLTENKEKLQEYKAKRESNQEATELLNEELLQTQIIAGLTDVTGNGVVITYKDDIESGYGKVRAHQLIELVNELKFAGAEAISINDNRIVNMSDIVEIWMNEEEDSFFILVNKNRVTSPYIIKAIGDQKTLESTLTAKTSGYISRYSNATLQTQNNIKILKYTGDIKLKYAADVVKEEN